MPRRKILPTPQPVGDIIGRMIKREKWPVYREDRALLGRWERVVGETIARQTRPDRVTCGVLYVRVATSTWRQELHFLKGEILSGLNAIPGEEPISDIRFFLGEIAGSCTPPPPQELPPPRQAFLTARDQRMMEESLAPIADPELRAILHRVMEKEISRRRQWERAQGR